MSMPLSTGSSVQFKDSFKNHTLRRLGEGQRDAFNKRLEKLVRHFKRGTPFEEERRKLTNSDIKRGMESLLKHLNHVCAASGSGSENKFQRYFWGAYIGWKASDDDRKVIAGFPRMAELMRRIVADSISSKSYETVPHDTELPRAVAMTAAQLLKQFEIKPTTTVGSAWVELTQYILYHGCGRVEETENIRNYLKKVKGYF